MTGKLPAGTPPHYCSKDGFTLQRRSITRHMGWDVFTGADRGTRTIVLLECKGAGHDVWVLSDDGEWWVTP